MTTADSRPTTLPIDDPLWRGPSPFLALQEHAVTAFLFLCAAITVLTTAGIVLVLGVETIDFFRVSKIGVFDFVGGTVLRPEADPPLFGVLPLAWGTFVVAAGSSLIALPIGLLSAIYLSEYAPRRSAPCSNRRWNCSRAFPRLFMDISRCCS